jgi:hypothetical protein
MVCESFKEDGTEECGLPFESCTIADALAAEDGAKKALESAKLELSASQESIDSLKADIAKMKEALQAELVKLGFGRSRRNSQESQEAIALAMLSFQNTINNLERRLKGLEADQVRAEKAVEDAEAALETKEQDVVDAREAASQGPATTQPANATVSTRNPSAITSCSLCRAGTSGKCIDLSTKICVDADGTGACTYENYVACDVPTTTVTSTSTSTSSSTSTSTSSTTSTRGCRECGFGTKGECTMLLEKQNFCAEKDDLGKCPQAFPPV